MKTHDMGAMIVGAAVIYRDEVADGSLVRRGDSNTQYPRVQHQLVDLTVRLGYGTAVPLA